MAFVIIILAGLLLNFVAGFARSSAADRATANGAVSIGVTLFLFSLQRDGEFYVHRLFDETSKLIITWCVLCMVGFSAGEIGRALRRSLDE